MSEEIQFRNKSEKVRMHIPVCLGAVLTATLLIGAPIVGCVDRKHRNEVDVLFRQTYSNHLDIARKIISNRNGENVPIDYNFTHQDKEYLVHLPINIGADGVWHNQSNLR